MSTAGRAQPSVAQRRALDAFASKHGRTWKTVLKRQWVRGDSSPYLQQVRNEFGPYWLASYKAKAPRPTRAAARKRAKKPRRKVARKRGGRQPAGVR